MKEFILWDPRDGKPDLSSSGLMGVLPENNVYISTYAHNMGKSPGELEVGQSVEATFNLSGSKGSYLIVRVS